MTNSQLQHALSLLESAIALLETRNTECPTALARELRRLTLELDLLRISASQVAPATHRN